MTFQIQQANPVGAFLQGRGMAQQQQAQQQQMDLQRRQFGMQETQFNQGQQDRERQQQMELLADIGQAADWILAEPNEAPARLEQARAIYRPIFGDAVNNITLEQLPMLRAQVQQELQGAMPAPVRAFNEMTQGLSDEERERARRIELGLEGRASNAGIGFREVVGPDGVTRLVATDPRTGQVSAPNASGVDPAQLQSRPEEVQAGLTESSKVTARAAAEREAAAPQRMERARQQIAAIDNTFAAIDRAMQDVGWNTAGPVGALLQNIPGTEARDLQQTVQTIKANIGFDRLQAMRDASPTGGALGQVAIQELAALQASIASLDQAQTPGQLRENLAAVRRHYENWRNVVTQTGEEAAQSVSNAETPEAPRVRRYNPATGRIE